MNESTNEDGYFGNDYCMEECRLSSCEGCIYWIQVLKEEDEYLDEFLYLENMDIEFG